MPGAGCFERWSWRILLAGSLWAAAASAQVTRQDATTQPAPTTQPADLGPDISAAVRLLEAGDKSLVPTALLWLGSERDGIRVGMAPSRLRLAIHAARKFQITAAVPWLVAIYDDPTAEQYARNAAADAAIRIDPFYSREFLDDVLDDQLMPMGSLESLSSAQCAAAAALAQLNDERALAMLVDAMTDYLDGIDKGGPINGKESRNFETAMAISRMDSGELLNRFRAMKSRYTRPPAAVRLREMIDQLQMNRLPVERLIAMAGPDKDAAQREVAILALGNKAGAETIPFIQSAERNAAAELRKLVAMTQPAAGSQPAVEPQPSARTQPAAEARRVAAETQPIADTQPAVEAKAARHSVKDEIFRRRELIQACHEAMEQIAARTPIRQNLPGGKPMTRGPIPPPGEPVPDDAELVFLNHLGTHMVGDRKAHIAEFSDVQGLLPTCSAAISNEAFFQSLIHVPYGELARIKLSPDRTELVGIRLLDRGPGETALDGYTCVGHTVVRQGQWENKALRLRKYGIETVALIPNRRKADGILAPDAAMSKVADVLGPGDPVLARFEPGPGATILQSLSPYRPRLTATFVKLTKAMTPGGEQPAAELIVARRRATCLLPAEGEESSDPLALDSATLASLPSGAPLSVVVDDAANPHRLLDVYMDGGIAVSADSGLIAVRAGQAIYLGRSERGWHGTLELSGSRNIGTYFLAAGIEAAVADPAHPGALQDGFAQLLQLARNHASESYADVNAAIPDLMARWLAAEPPDRLAILREMELHLCRASIDAAAHEEEVYREARRVLSPRQYRQAMSLGQTSALPGLQAVSKSRAAASQRTSLPKPDDREPTMKASE